MDNLKRIHMEQGRLRGVQTEVTEGKKRVLESQNLDALEKHDRDCYYSFKLERGGRVVHSDNAITLGIIWPRHSGKDDTFGIPL